MYAYVAIFSSIVRWSLSKISFRKSCISYSWNNLVVKCYYHRYYPLIFPMTKCQPVLLYKVSTAKKVLIFNIYICPNGYLIRTNNDISNGKHFVTFIMNWNWSSYKGITRGFTILWALDPLRIGSLLTKMNMKIICNRIVLFNKLVLPKLFKLFRCNI